MTVEEPPFTVGIEEEYLLVERATGALANDPPAGLVGECEKRLAALGGRAASVTPEFLRAQIEVQTGDDGRSLLRWKKVDAWRDWAALSEGCYLLRTNITDWSDERSTRGCT